MNPPPWFAQPTSPHPIGGDRHALIVGGGIAACAMAYALGLRGWRITLLESAGTTAAGASGNRCALLRPHRPNTSDPDLAALMHKGFKATRATLDHLQNLGYAIDCAFPGALQRIASDNQKNPLDTVGNEPGNRQASHGQQSHEETPASHLDQAQATSVLGIPTHEGGWWFPDAGRVSIADFCQALLAACPQLDVFTRSPVTSLRYEAGIWQADTPHTIHRAPVAIMASGAALAELLPGTNVHEALAMSPVAGQITRLGTTHNTLPKAIICGRRFAIPIDNTLVAGASYHRLGHRPASPAGPVAEDDLQNLSATETLLPELQGRLQIIDHWWGLRCSSADRLPVVGAMPDLHHYRNAYQHLRHGPRHQQWPPAHYHHGLYVFGGLGSHGLLYSQILAEMLASLIDGQLDAQQRRWLTLVHPARFLIRQLRGKLPIKVSPLNGLHS